MLSCVEPSGKVVWTGDLQSQAKIEASPTGADNKIYCVNFKGDVFVVGTGDTFELLHKTALGGENDKRVRSTIAVSEGRLFVRTDTKLWCIGKK